MEESFNQFLFAIPLYLFLAVLGIFAILLIAVQAINLRLRHRLRRLYPYRAIVPLIPAALSAGFWFWSAPDPRFAGSAFWLLATCALLMLILLLPAKIPGWLSVPIVIAPLIAAAAIVAINFGTDVSFDGDGFPRLPQASIAVYQTDSGLSVNISGNPNDTLELWDAPLPASPYKLPALELRGSDLKDGFRMAGTR